MSGHDFILLSAMPSPWYIFAVLIGLVPLGIGLVLGYWLGKVRHSRARATSNPPSEDLHQMLEFTHHFADDVNHHLELMERLEQKLAEPSEAAEDGSLGKAVRIIAEMNQANHRLRRNLEEAEAVLQSRSEQLSRSISEARTDSLTGLLNRRALDEHLAEAWNRWKTDGTGFSLILLDIDNFKQVNDTRGHTVGDEILRQFASELRQLLWGSDILARFGGEEMALVMPETEIEAARHVALRVLEGVRRKRFSMGGEIIQITASCGLVSTGARPAEVADMLRLADEALYQAKRQGRDRGYWHDGQQMHPLARSQSEAASATDSQPDADPDPEKPQPPESTQKPTQCSSLDGAMQRLRSRLSELNP